MGVTGLDPPASHSATMRVKSIWKLNVLIKTKKLGRKQSRRLFSEDRDLNLNLDQPGFKLQFCLA